MKLLESHIVYNQQHFKGSRMWIKASSQVLHIKLSKTDNWIFMLAGIYLNRSIEQWKVEIFNARLIWSIYAITCTLKCHTVSVINKIYGVLRMGIHEYFRNIYAEMNRVWIVKVAGDLIIVAGLGKKKTYTYMKLVCRICVMVIFKRSAAALHS